MPRLCNSGVHASGFPDSWISLYPIKMISRQRDAPLSCLPTAVNPSLELMVDGPGTQLESMKSSVPITPPKVPYPSPFPGTFRAADTPRLIFVFQHLFFLVHPCRSVCLNGSSLQTGLSGISNYIAKAVTGFQIKIGLRSPRTGLRGLHRTACGWGHMSLRHRTQHTDGRLSISAPRHSPSRQIMTVHQLDTCSAILGMRVFPITIDVIGGVVFRSLDSKLHRSLHDTRTKLSIINKHAILILL